MLDFDFRPGKGNENLRSVTPKPEAFMRRPGLAVRVRVPGVVPQAKQPVVFSGQIEIFRDPVAFNYNDQSMPPYASRYI